MGPILVYNVPVNWKFPSPSGLYCDPQLQVLLRGWGINLYVPYKPVSSSKFSYLTYAFLLSVDLMRDNSNISLGLCLDRGFITATNLFPCWNYLVVEGFDLHLADWTSSLSAAITSFSSFDGSSTLLKNSGNNDFTYSMCLVNVFMVHTKMALGLLVTSWVSSFYSSHLRKHIPYVHFTSHMFCAKLIWSTEYDCFPLDRKFCTSLWYDISQEYNFILHKL